MNNSFANSAFTALCQVAEARTNELQKYNRASVLSDSDDERDSTHPIYDTFLQSIKPLGIQKMTNFSPAEIKVLYDYLNPIVSPVWNRGRGNRCNFTTFDVLFMVLTVYKNGGSWDFLSSMFKIQSATFQRIIHRYVETVEKGAFKLLVEDKRDFFKMKKLIEKGTLFNNYPEALYATDVTFQQCNRPTGIMEETKVYYSGKHHLYGYKTEMSVLPNGLAIGMSTCYPGSVSDIEIFRKNGKWHEEYSKKQLDEINLSDEGELNETHPSSWAILCDKGYTGLSAVFRTVTPDKKPANGWLTVEQNMRNQKIASDRILVENYFGRLCTFTLFGAKWRWDEHKYSTFLRFGVALTNAHVMWNPLRSADRVLFNSIQNRLVFIGESYAKKRASSQHEYRDRRRQRLSGMLSHNVSSENCPTGPDDNV